MDNKELKAEILKDFKIQNNLPADFKNEDLINLYID